MPKEKTKMSVEEIKDALLKPVLINHLYNLKVSNQHENFDGKNFLLSVYGLCVKYEEIQKELDDLKNTIKQGESV